MKDKSEIESKLKELHARHKTVKPASNEWWALAGEASALFWVLDDPDHLKELSEEKLPEVDEEEGHEDF